MKCRAMTRIMHICMVLVVVVSAFFYVPMEVSAEVSSTVNKFYNNYHSFQLRDPNYVYLKDYLDSDDGFYDIAVTVTVNFESNIPTFLNNFFVTFNSCGMFEQMSYNSSAYETNIAHTETRHFYLDASSSRDFTKFDVRYYFIAGFSSTPTSFTCNCSYTIDNVAVSQISLSDYESYQNGYNAGYSAGEQAGECNGYSSGYSDGYEAGEQSGYDTGFQAGKDSVDTQSYYDAGYSAGYDAGYLSGYDTGYDAGWSAYEAQMDKWGADTSDYPILVYKKNLSDVSCEMEVVTNMPSVGHGQVNLCNLDININPSHTYKIVFDSVYPSVSVGDMAGSMDEQFNYNIGLFSIPWSSGESFGFVQGSSLSSVFRLEVYDYSAHYYEIGGENDVFQPWEGYRIYNFDTIDVFVYDMGPSGDTQNHIANQTDQLTNGYDSSQGAVVNDDFKASVNEYHTAEDSLFSTATTSLENFTFLDFTSITGMVTSLSFVTSIMTSIYMAMGGDTGASGIILAVLFSVMLVSMAIGLYRYYVSNGKTDGSGKGGD